MSSWRSDKCTKQEIKQFKQEVIKWLKNYGIKTEGLDIRGYTSYNGDVKIFTDDYMEFTNTKYSFRRSGARKDENGKTIGYTGMRGHHTTKITCPILINRDEWKNFKKDIESKDPKMFYEDYKKLQKLIN